MAIKRQTYSRLAANICILILVNVLATMLYFRVDLTADNRYSLSNTSQEILEELDDIVYVKVYLEGDFPAGFTRLQNASHQMLDEFRSYSPYIEYEFINPSESGNQEERRQVYKQLYEQGLIPTNLQVQEKNGSSEQIIFPGAIIFYKSRSVAINLLQSQLGTHPEIVLNNSIENIEYEFANALQKLVLNRKPRIAFLDGNGELDEVQTADISSSLGMEKGSLAEYYQIERFNIKEWELDESATPSLAKQQERLNQYKAVIIAKPSEPFSDVEKFLLDQYIMNGGKVLWFLDGIAMNMDSLQGATPYSIALPLRLNLDDQLFKYGVRINMDLVMDMQADKIPVITGYQGDVPQQSLFPWFYNPLFIPKNNHPIAKNLDAIRSSFVSTIDTVKAAGVKKTGILFSSPYTKVVKSPHRVSLNLLEQEPQLEQYQAGEQMIATLLEGEFTSVFQNRLVPQGAGIQFQEKSKPTKMLVVADGDIIKNHVSKSGNPYPLGYNPFSKEQFNGNKNFIVNAVNYLLDNEGLIEIRSRELKLRLLDKNEVSEHKLKWQIINIFLPILLILILGFIWNYLRKRKYA